MSRRPPIVSFVGRSGTGKTTFLEGLIPALLDRGVRVMVIKHDVHGFEVDRPGKDTWRLRQAGARQVLIANDERMALMGDVDGAQPLVALVERYASAVDLVLTEGYRRSGMPKVLVARSGAPQPFDPGPEELADALAVVTDHALDLDLPQLPLDDPEPCADLLVERVVRPEGRRRALTGVLLAGGISTRMGGDKATLVLDGSPLLPRLAERLASVCDGGVIVVRRSIEQELPALPDSVRVAEDILPEHAALGGLYTGLVLAETPFVFLAACDMPLLAASFVGWLRDRPPFAADVLLPIHEGIPQTMHAIYGHRCLAAIKEALLSGEYRMDGWHGSVRVERIEEEVWRARHPSGRSFFNANLPEDLEAVSRLLVDASAVTLPDAGLLAPEELP